MIFPATPENIEKAAQIIRDGGIVAFPTETVYGLGANALNPQAVEKIFEVKGRPSFNPLIVHIARPKQAEDLAAFTSDTQRRMYELLQPLWPGPLSIVLPKKSVVPEIVTGGKQSVALRIPRHDVARALLEKADVGIAAPSANPSNYLSPTTAQHVESMLGKRVDMILDGGPCAVGVESTVVSLLNNTAQILRPGGVTVETVTRLLSALRDPFSLSAIAEEQHLSPGQMQVHYAPHTKIVWADDRRRITIDPSRAAYIAFSDKRPSEPFHTFVCLGNGTDLEKAAGELFSTLHDLDTRGLDCIVVERCPPTGIGLAIMDRLEKACAKYERGDGNSE